jgi:hypothetical protein
MMSRFNRLKLVLKISGFLGLVRFVIARIVGQSNMIRPASTVDIRRSGLYFSHDVIGFVTSLLGESKDLLTEDMMLEAAQINSVIELRAKESENAFPENWNSEEQLRVALYLLVRLLKPALVIETGTANGSSAAAVCAGLSANNFGALISVDVKESSATLVAENHRSFLHLRKTNGTNQELREICETAVDKWNGVKIFLHDSDHSYFGQYSDYKIAADLGFDIILSDDVDASLAFADFAGRAGKALFDTRKIIGGMRNSI